MKRIDVIATTISGSISDWKKVERIAPLFAAAGFADVRLHAVETHLDARRAACASLIDGGRIPISAGGSGTFRAVLEGCIDADIPLSSIRLGFLRKGSADLIGKVLDMPDVIEDAVAVFAESIRRDQYIHADILQVHGPGSDAPPQHFIGYSGAELFGRIPYYTENRFIKYYKGVLGQLFGDLGPFTMGMTLAIAERVLRAPFRRSLFWEIIADGTVALRGKFQAILVVNGYLGPELAFSDQPLGSGEFYAFGIRDLGSLKLVRQAIMARKGSSVEAAEKWGLCSVSAKQTLQLVSDRDVYFPVNVDGHTLMTRHAVEYKRLGQVPLITGGGAKQSGKMGEVSN